MNKVIIIAEAGVNHNGNIGIAKKMIDAAVECGVDIIKFQTAKVEALVTRNAEQADYQINNTKNKETQMEMLKKITMPYRDFDEIYEYCRSQGIQFLSTPFDLESVDFLKKYKMPFWKIPSGEITNYPYLAAIAKTGKDIVMSTGMSNLEEIEEALGVLKNNGCGNVQLLQCNTEYPTPMEDVNLLAMKTLEKKFHVRVGYSDHTEGIEASIAAVAMGACIIEKHFTLDRNMEGPDHKASLEVKELARLVTTIRNVEKAIGDGVKKPSDSEKKNIKIARKSIVAKRGIRKGEIFTEENITTKRPGNGISAMKWNEIIGRYAVRDFCEDELIEMKDEIGD